jgi:hypothetical protein
MGVVAGNGATHYDEVNVLKSGGQLWLSHQTTATIIEHKDIAINFCDWTTRTNFI